MCNKSKLERRYIMKIVAVHKEDNQISQYKLDDGRVVDKAKCIKLVKNGQIENCNIGKNKEGEEFVRTDRDDEDKPGQITNLSDMPTF